MTFKSYTSLTHHKTQTFDESPVASIAVRLRNEIKGLDFFYKSLMRQTFLKKTELVFLDSGSVDGSLEYLLTQNCSLYSINSSEFQYGDSCNLILSLTSTEIVILLSAHIVLEQDNLIETAYLFFKDKHMSAGYFRQIPNYFIGATDYDKAVIRKQYPSSKGKASVMKINSHSFSNAGSIIQKEAWRLIPFRNVNASEDFLWANQLLSRGGILFYLSDLAIQHSHAETPEQISYRVRINVEVRFPGGVSRVKVFIIYLKVWVGVFLISFNLKNALKYAKAHSSAYRKHRISKETNNSNNE